MNTPVEAFKHAIVNAIVPDPLPPGLVRVLCHGCWKPSFTSLEYLTDPCTTKVLGECCRPGSHYPKG